MKTLTVPLQVRESVGNAGSDGLLDMFADSHTLASESFERRLGEEIAKVRLDLSELRFDLLKWSFLFWVGQVAAVSAVLSLLLRR